MSVAEISMTGVRGSCKGLTRGHSRYPFSRAGSCGGYWTSIQRCVRMCRRQHEEARRGRDREHSNTRQAGRQQANKRPTCSSVSGQRNLPNKTRALPSIMLFPWPFVSEQIRSSFSFVQWRSENSALRMQDSKPQRQLGVHLACCISIPCYQAQSALSSRREAVNLLKFTADV